MVFFKSKVIVVSAAFAALSACVETEGGAVVDAAPASTTVVADKVTAGAGGDRTALRAQLNEELLDLVIPGAIASQIGKRCSDLRYNAGQFKSNLTDAEKEFSARGYSSQDFQAARRNLDEAGIQRRMFAWLEKRSVVVPDKSSWCAAGAKEISDGSDIASYLIEK